MVCTIVHKTTVALLLYSWPRHHTGTPSQQEVPFSSTHSILSIFQQPYMDALHISQVPATPVPINICPIADGYCTTRNQQEEWPSPPQLVNLTFSTYLNALPEHESLLLTHYALLQGYAVATCALITNLSDVILVSDGGAMDNHGLFGWVLGLQDGTRLAHANGIVYGHEPRSYCAEGYGAKAGALFLWNLFQYFKCTIPDATEAG
jgi:hypothetical protein